MYSWHGHQVEHLTKYEVHAIEIVWRDRLEVTVGVDVDGDIDDGHATAPHVVEEGDCRHQWSAPIPWAGERS